MLFYSKNLKISKIKKIIRRATSTTSITISEGTAIEKSDDAPVRYRAERNTMGRAITAASARESTIFPLKKWSSLITSKCDYGSHCKLFNIASCPAHRAF